MWSHRVGHDWSDLAAAVVVTLSVFWGFSIMFYTITGWIHNSQWIHNEFTTLYYDFLFSISLPTFVTCAPFHDSCFDRCEVTEVGDCSHEIERHLLLERKAMTSLGSILKSRDSPLPAKVCLVKAVVFPVVMYGCESWIIKKPERRRIDAFELWCWRRLLRVPWIARRSNQSILK